MKDGPVYDETAGRRGAEGERSVCRWLIESGFKVTNLPKGLYGPDHLCRSDRETFHVETERRMGWKGEEWPRHWRTVHVPTRRKVTLDRIFVTINFQMTHGIVIFARDLLASGTEQVDNYRMQGEKMRVIAYERCLPVWMQRPLRASFAEANGERVRRAMENLTHPGLRARYLQPVCPYGIEHTEWMEMMKPVTPKWHPESPQVPDKLQRQGMLF